MTTMTIDTKNMKQVLLNFPNQLQDSIKTEVQVPVISNISNIVVCGVGGSAIAGDIIANILSKELTIPVLVNRTYESPNYVGPKSLVLVSSYSGNTEETLSAYNEIRKKTQNIICISSGGILSEMKPPYLLKLPTGYQPRCALGWSVGAMINILQKLNLIEDKTKELHQTANLLSNNANTFSEETSEPANLASSLLDKLPVIYSDSTFEPIARRWTNQLNENSKIMAHYNVFPELNHNEIVGFGNPNLSPFVIVLKDKSYSERINSRIDITKRIYNTSFYFVESKGDSLLSRFFYLIYFGDWTSYWLAIKRKIDPTPVERIENLKKELANLQK